MTPDRTLVEKLAEAVRLAKKALPNDVYWRWKLGQHCNPEFVLEVAREVERLKRVEEKARKFLMNAESKQTFLGNDWYELLAAVVPEDEWLGPEHAQEHLLPRWRDAALANPAAEAGDR